MPNPTRPSLSRALRVPDAETEHVFLTQAKQAWREAHPDQAPRRGHPLERDHLFSLIDRVLDELYPTRGFRWPEHLRQSTIIQRLLQQMEDGVSPRSNGKTVKKYVRLYALEHSSFKELKKGNRMAWLQKQRSPVLREITTSLRTMTQGFAEAMLEVSWHLVVRYALGPAVRTLPSQFTLAPSLTGAQLEEALHQAIQHLGHRLLCQHPRHATFETYEFPRFRTLIKGRHFQPLRHRRRHHSHPSSGRRGPR